MYLHNNNHFSINIRKQKSPCIQTEVICDTRMGDQFPMLSAFRRVPGGSSGSSKLTVDYPANSSISLVTQYWFALHACTVQCNKLINRGFRYTLSRRSF